MSARSENRPTFFELYQKLEVIEKQYVTDRKLERLFTFFKPLSGWASNLGNSNNNTFIQNTIESGGSYTDDLK